MLLPLLAFAASAFAAPTPAGYDGQCFYPPGLGDPAPLEVRVTCDHVSTDANGMEFSDTNWDARMLRFSGEWQDERLTVTSVTQRNGQVFEARGLCRIYRTNEEVSVIACTAVNGARTWIGNFRVSRI